MNENIAIKVDGLGKRYSLGAGGRQHDSIRDLLVDKVGGLFRRKRSQGPNEFWALNDASFEIKKGENVGLIGLNGAGKSTLLKILSRITAPTLGTAAISGRVGALLEVGTGFHPELTGRENAFLYGSILGMGREEIARKLDDIIDFAEIRPFIDTPVKRYSSGMYVRLAFAVAAHLEPEILLLDEVLAVGDLTFQRKCMEFAKKLQRRQATILFVSHNMFSIKTMCSRVIYLKKGRVVFDGPTDEGIGIYERDCMLGSVPWMKSEGEAPVRVTDVEILAEDGTPRSVFEMGERMRIRLAYEAIRPLDSPTFILSMTRSDGIDVCNFNTETDGVDLGRLEGKGTLELRTPPLKLVSEVYSLSILVRERGFKTLLAAQMGGSFHVRHELFDGHFGVFHEPAEWSGDWASSIARPAERRA
ncbi:MAG: ABC transporter ATP-binding protein [Gammaproteobacteria bacterium]